MPIFSRTGENMRTDTPRNITIQNMKPMSYADVAKSTRKLTHICAQCNTEFKCVGFTKHRWSCQCEFQGIASNALVFWCCHICEREYMYVTTDEEEEEEKTLRPNYHPDFHLDSDCDSSLQVPAYLGSEHPSHSQ